MLILQCYNILFGGGYNFHDGMLDFEVFEIDEVFFLI